MGSLESIKPSPIPTQDPNQSNPATSSATTMITTTLLITTLISTSFAVLFFSSTPTRHHTATIIHHAPPLTKLKHPTIILVSSDGFRFGYQYKTPTPNIDRLINNGTEAKTGLIPVFPTLTFPNHYSIVTGLYPSYHGIINNKFYDPKSGQTFTMSNHDPYFWLGEPLWETITKHGLLAATYFWPGSEVTKGAWDCDIKYCKPYNESVPFEERVDTVLSYFDVEKSGDVPVFMTLYFEDPDHQGHQVGPDDVEVTNAVSRIDGLIGRLISGLEKRGVFEDVTVIMVGDHGMVGTCDQKVVYLDDLVPWVNVTEEWVQYYSPVLSIRPPLGVSVKDVVAKMNEGLSSGKVKNGDKLKVYLKEDLPDRLHYWESDRIPPIIGLVAEGYTIEQKDKNVKECGGAHGYDNAFFSMRTIFIGHGPQFAKDDDYEVVPYSVGIVSEEGGEKLWIPDIPDGEKPAYGIMYHSLEQAYEYYKDYAKRAGFEIRLGQHYKSTKNKDNNPDLQYFVCSKEGINPAPKKVGSKRKHRKHPSKRTDCKAVLRVRYVEGKGYWCYEFVEGHNHSLVSQEDSVFLVSSRDVSYTQQVFLYQASQVNLGPVKGFHLLRQIYGDYDFIGVSSVDCKNYRRDVLDFIGKNDAQMLVEMLLNKKDFHPNFSFEYQTGENNALTNLFWADEYAKRNYYAFGDVMSFDATFRTNKYKMVFVPFTGIDNHNNCVTYGAALLSSETKESYIWLLECFQRAFVRAPKVIVTDQDASMKVAIETVFPLSRHRLCMWHIMQKLTSKVGPDLAKDETFKRRISDIVWTDRIEPDEFEALWEKLLVDFDLKSHKWLSDMYDLRYKWIPAYYRNELMSGLMRTSSRSESENNAYGRLTSIDLTLWEFYNHFESVVGCQSFAQRKNDHDSRYTIPDMHTELQLEKEASELYTRSIFFDVQNEIYASVISCMSVSVSDVNSGKKFVIKDTGEDEQISRRHRIVKGKPQYDVFYEVLCKPAEEFYQCTCKRFESYGLLCRHIFYVIRFSNVKNFPKKYVLRRWSKDSLPPPSVIQATGDSPDMILREIFRSVEYCVNRYANDPELLQKFRDHQVQLMAKADADVPIPPKTTKRDRIASILGVSQPDEIIVNVPKQVSTKGSRKRIKSSVERSLIASGKRRKKNCTTCKSSMNDHNQAKCNAIKAQIAAKKASEKAAAKEMKQKARLAAKNAKLAEKTAARKANLAEKTAARNTKLAEKTACVVT